MSEIVIVNTRPEHIDQLVQHQRICFPTLADHELMRREHFESQLRIFPEGQHVALDGERVVGQSSTFRISGAVAFAPHTYHWIVAGNFFTNHDPQGEWLYGADMSVHPDYRGRGISRMLYNARKDLVRRLGLRGMVGGGMIPGYVRYRDRMSPLEYAQAVAAGVLTDPTLTPQLRAGFELRGILPNYIEAGELGNDSTLIVWECRE
ncbi:MAG: GNAT family N-acetyltransferase [Roseiflexus sp.]|jgi:GNAT superfamily N-acetyltransferase|nr:GNAT family N-acetyltransferase [Roseiflexus sp.]